MVILRETPDRKTKYRFLFFGIILVILLAIISGAPVFAAQCGGADTTLVECGNDEGGIWHILSLILDIMSIGIGILGVIGIMVAGIQYLTAGDKEDQAKKAKSRIYEIVLGLVFYAVLFVALEWLMPGGLINADSPLASMGNTNEIEQQEAEREAQRQEANQSRPSSSSPSSSPSSDPGDSSSNTSKAKKISDLAWRIVKGKVKYDDIAKATGYYDYMKKNCYKIGGGDCGRGKKGYRTFCSGFTYNVIRYTGADPNFPMKLTGKQMKYANNSSKWKNVTSTVNGKTSKLKPGDLLIKSGHTLLITQNSKGKLYTAQAAVGVFEPKKSKVASNTRLDNSAGNLSNYQVFRIVE